MEVMGYIMVVAGGYLLGSIPTGFLTGKARGIDIRKAGSGNIGATNVLRLLGKPAGIFVLVMDGLKGFASAHWLPLLVLIVCKMGESHRESLMIAGGVSAVLGHNYTCWLNFKGGKGIATSAGVLAALVPWSLLIILTVWILLTLLTGYVSVGSIAASFVLPFASWATHASPTMIWISAILGVLAIYKHRSNILRLINGTETPIRAKKRKEVTS